MKPKKGIFGAGKRLDGKKIAITGSTGGLGRVLCAELAALGADLILLDRNAERSQAHRTALLERFPKIRVRCMTLDLEDLARAERVVAELIDEKVDVFLHNAGAYSIPRHLCDSGYENVFQINFATPYYMIRKLLPTLRARKGRVVVVGSIAHQYSRIDPDDVDFRTRRASSRVYGNAKRYLMFALYALFEEEREASVAVTHPGITFTNITAHYPRLIFALIKHPMKLIFMKPHRAARSILAGVFEKTETCEWIGPRLFDIWGKPSKKKLRSVDLAERKQIAMLAETVYNTCCKTVNQIPLKGEEK